MTTSLRILALVLAACGGATDAPSRIAIDPPQPRLLVGDELTLGVRDDAGQPYDGAVVWTSSNPAVATTSQGGVVNARALGATEIRATARGLMASARLSVAEGGRAGPTGGTVTARGGAVNVELPAGGTVFVGTP